MEAPLNPFKQALRERRQIIGMWLAMGSPYTAEMCADAGFDWLLIDAEHGPNDLRSVLAQLQAIAGYRAMAVVRPPMGEPWFIKQLLDIGAQTLLVPLVETREQAEALVAATRYPPRGIRGVGASMARASAFSRRNRYLATADEQICLLVQVETATGLKNLEAIATVEGIDGVFIGPSDLSAGLGHLGNPTHPDAQRAIEEAIGRILAVGKPPGILFGDETYARRYLELGAVFVGVGTDVTLFVRTVQGLSGRFGLSPAPDVAKPAGPSVY